MSYPRDDPINKHDVVGPWPLHPRAPSLKLPSHPAALFSDSAVFSALSDRLRMTSKSYKSWCKRRGMALISNVYTYPDAPTQPKTPSRTLEIVGFADVSLRVVQTLDGPALGNVMTKCTVGVRRGDGKYRRYIESDACKLRNSERFAELVIALRRAGMAAIVGVDSVGRFGVLVPMADKSGDGGDDVRRGVDYAAHLYVGRFEEAKEAVLNPTAFETKGDDKVVAGPGTPQYEPPATPLYQPPGAPPCLPPRPPPNQPLEKDFGGRGRGSSSSGSGQKRSHTEMENSGEGGKMDASETFHADAEVKVIAAFYSDLTRTFKTRGKSRLFHMRNSNGWVKATQIAELDPATRDAGGRKRGNKHPLRVLDLACGKGGDLGKWILHHRGVRNYVGIDVARGSLKEAAKRAREVRSKLGGRCVFTCADLGADVPGRPRAAGTTKVQKLLSWSMAEERPGENGDPTFQMVTGGGIGPDDAFDVVSIQFAIHYMMSSRRRARRFFQTVSQLLKIGGNLIFTTIDSRVVLDHLMDLGIDLHLDSREGAEEGDDGKNNCDAVVEVGEGACQLKFQGPIIRKLFAKKNRSGRHDPLDTDLFGLKYTFTLVEGEDHDKGFGKAVDLQECLCPLPTLTALAAEVGLELEYASNFHEFYQQRRDPDQHYAAHAALSNMKVLDWNGSISAKEWDISRMHMAAKFRKEREPKLYYC